jgi:hypothetical protein
VSDRQIGPPGVTPNEEDTFAGGSVRKQRESSGPCAPETRVSGLALACPDSSAGPSRYRRVGRDSRCLAG